MHDQNDIAVDPESLKPTLEIALVIDKSVGAVRRGTRITHTNIIRSETTTKREQVRNDVPPQIGRRGSAVQEHDRVARTNINISHWNAVNINILPVGDLFSGNLRVSHSGYLSCAAKSFNTCKH